MQFSEIGNGTGRFVLHRDGKYLGEGWLLQFGMWPLSSSDGVGEYSVNLGDITTSVWFVEGELQQVKHKLDLSSQLETSFVVTAATVVTGTSLHLLALAVDGRFVWCYDNEADARKAMVP